VRPAVRTSSGQTSAGQAGGARRPDARTVPSARWGLSQLTRRAVVLVLVLVALGVSAALPMKDYLSQRAQISALEQQREQTKSSVAALEDEKRRLQDPAYVAAEARRRLHFVLPGETAYVLVDPPPAVPEAGAEAPRGSQSPWYSQIWGSVREADRPAGQ